MTLDEMMKSMMEDAVKANKPVADTEDVAVMLLGLYQQNQEHLEKQDRLIELINKLITKEPIKVTTQEVRLPSIMEVEEVSPVKEVAINNLGEIQWPSIKPYFDALSTENAKGQFAIIDTLEQILAFLKSIDLTKLQTKTTEGYGGVITPRWYVETPAGSINDSNKAFTLTTTPKPNSLFLFLGGILQTENEDYTISRNVISYINPPASGVTPHIARYQV